MNNNTKQKIAELIKEEGKYRPYSQIATKAGVSSATISQMVNGNWALIRSSMWHKVAAAVNYSSGEWNYVETTNSRLINTSLELSQSNGLFMAIAAPAGSGKTVALKHYAGIHKNVYYIESREWAKREFLRNLAQSIGISVSKYSSGNYLEAELINFFVKNKSQNPMLIVDQANSLKLSAMKFFIHLYNALDGRLPIIWAGTDALESNIKKGVERNVSGFDELDSRVGRNMIHLPGNNANDVVNICLANGIANEEMAHEIFKEAQPSFVKIKNRTIKVVKDLRRVERIIIRNLKVA